MNAKYLFTALASIALLASCSRSEMVPNAETPEANGNLVEVGSDFHIAVADDPDTKTNWTFADATGGRGPIRSYWVPTGSIAPEIGLCWTGAYVDEDGEDVYLIPAGENVYSNYMFKHDGWLAEGETAPEWDFPCNPGDLLNGWLYSEVAGMSGDVVSNGYGTGAWTEFTAAVTAKGSFTTPDYHTGVFTTSNSTMFGGNYIVYHPYTEAFDERGPIVAESPVVFNDLLTNDDGLIDPQLGNSLFSYRHVRGLVGGTQAEGISFSNLSSVVRLQIKAVPTESVNYASTEVIDRVVLYDPSGFVTEVELNAAEIVAGKTGENIYIGTPEKNSTICAYPGTPAALVNNAAVNYFVTALPTTLTAPELLIYRADGKIAKLPVTSITGNKIPAGASVSANVEVKEGDFKNAYYIVDNDSFDDAIVAATNLGTPTARILFQIIGDLEINGDKTVPEWVDVKGDDIIVPETYTLTLSDGVDMQCDVYVEGEDCCSASGNAGHIIMSDALISGNVFFEDPIAPGRVMGDLTINAGAVVAPNAYGLPRVDGIVSGAADIDINTSSLINNVVAIDGDVTVADNQTVVFADALACADVYVNAHAKVRFMGNVDIDELDAANGSNLLLAEGQTMNISTSGILRADGNAAGPQTLFTVNGTLNNETSFTVESNDAVNDAKLEVSSTGAYNNLEDAKTIFEGVYASRGNASNAGTVIDVIGSQVTGSTTGLGGLMGDGVNSFYISEVNNNANRFETAMYEKPSNVVRFVGNSAMYDMTKAARYNRYAATRGENAATSLTYEVKVTAGQTVTFTNNFAAGGSAIGGTAAINDLKVSSGYLLMNLTSARVANSINVFNIYNKMTVETIGDTSNPSVIVGLFGSDRLENTLDIQGLTVNKGAYVRFIDSINSNVDNLTIDAGTTTPAVAAGYVQFEKNSYMMTEKIVNNGTGEIVLATDGVNVDAKVFYTESETGTGVWPNGIPTQW